MNKEMKTWKEVEAVKLLRKVGVRKNQTVLDFGCGEGNYTRPAAKIVGDKGIVYAMDKKSEVLNELMQKTEEEGLQNIRRIDTSEKVKIPLEDKSVDVILLYDVIHLIGYQENQGQMLRRSTVIDRKFLLQQIYRIANPRTVISVFSPHLNTHTDVKSEDDIGTELENSGFNLQESFYNKLIHDGNLTTGHIFNFRKKANRE